MRSNTPSAPARRDLRQADRRSRRRPAFVASGVAFGLVAAATFAATSPAAQAEAVDSTTAPTYALASLKTTIEPAAATAASGTDEVATEALAALSAADATIAAAGSVTADIAASGLDLGVPDTSIDTSELTETVAQLNAAETLPAPFVAGITIEVTELSAEADARVAELRGNLEGAQAKKAEEEAAAEAARVAAEEAAAAEAAEAAEAAAPRASSSSSSGSAPAPAPAPVPVATGGGDNSPGGAQATARGMLSSRGWGDDQFGCLQSLWQKESGWNYRANNPSSGAYGIPQALPGSKMASAGADWATNAATQISWGFGYIQSRYGNPCGAWAKSQASGWY